ncbi:nmrA-like family protein [Thelonectria olida]|uniref:NmrA-like family protein n=1 Tax=Thelonectria olida TaxID=1576542 RepID=A0A9P8VYG1_9HYPO|nr:nmrA-like family protein [Thelonectria olida]
MVNVALAGGTGTVGKTIADVLASQDNHHAIILTRKTAELALPHFVVDYSNVDSLTAFLEEHEIHTIICAFGINATSLAKSQFNLIKAAEASSATKRFIPSSFATAYPEDGTKILPPLQSYFDSLKALEETNLEWAVVHNGTFLDYFAPPSLKSYYDHSTLVIDIPNAAAGIPGTGNEPVTLTYTFDVARFTVAALDLPSWPRELKIIGETLTFNELLALVETATGKKFNVQYDDLEKLRRSEITELPGHAKSYKKFPKDILLPFLSIFQRWMAEGLGEISLEGSLNERFPDIKPLTAKDMIKDYYKHED